MFTIYDEILEDLDSICIELEKKQEWTLLTSCEKVKEKIKQIEEILAEGFNN